ncbi:MAG: DUF4845 domain-containing protein [Gammaproteobacteria bacterium]|nr:DUF4845 domain-containing protein [Gammaproteobacteria bacterium]
MMHRQKGVSTAGWLLLLGVLSTFVLMGMRLVPAYMEFMSVERAFNAISDPGSKIKTPLAVRKALTKRFNVDNVDTINSADVKIDARGEKMRIWIDYEVRVKMISNIDAVVSFSKEVFIKHR